MAALTVTSFSSVNGVATAVVNTASASDTIQYVKGRQCFRIDKVDIPIDELRPKLVRRNVKDLYD